MSPPCVAVDVGPLAGRRTGIGVAVGAIVDVLARRDDVVVLPYLTSFRARPEPGTRRLPLPAAIAHRLWGATGRPRVDRWLRGADLVHGTNYVVPPSRLPRLVSVYDCWFLDHPGEAHPDVRRAGAVLLRAIHSGATVHACSAATAAAVRRHAPAAHVVHIPLAPLPVPDPCASPPIAELDGRPYVLAVGTLERRKNLPTLVRAFGRLAADHPDLLLVLAGGDGDDRAAVDAAVLGLGPEGSDRVLLAGWVDDDVRSWLLRHATVLAYPSLDEGFGFPLLDAMQVSLPIVATAVGSIPEVAGGAALLVDRPDDVAALAGALDRALTDAALRERLVSAGIQQLTTMSWERTATELVEQYTNLVSPGGAP